MLIGGALHILLLHKLMNTKFLGKQIIFPRRYGTIGRAIYSLLHYEAPKIDFSYCTNLNDYPYTKYREIVLLDKKYIIPKYNKNFKKKVIDTWLEKLK